MTIQIGTILMSVIAAIFGIYVVTKYQRWFVSHRLKLIILFLVLGIAVYTIGYLTKSPKDYFYAGLMAIFSAGRMFVFENDISSFEAGVAKYPLYNLAFALIMTMSMLTTAMIVLSFFGYRVICSIQMSFLRLMSRKRNLYVFAQLNQRALYLADDLKRRNKNNRIIFCRKSNSDTEEDKELEHKAADKGYLIKTVKQTEKDAVLQLYKHFYKSNLRVICIDEDDRNNISFVEEFSKRMQDLKRKKQKSAVHELPIYTFIKNKEYEELYNDEQLTGIDLHMIDENDLASRQLFQELTLMSCMWDTDTLTICVVGFTEITENLYKDISYLGQCKGVKLKLLMLDEDIQVKTATFFHQNPELSKCIELEYVPLKPNTTEFYEYFDKNLHNINCVINSDENITTAKEISRIKLNNDCKSKICVYVRDYDKYKQILRTKLLKECITFGALKDIFTEEIIINEKLDELAKGFHEYYAELYQDSRTWSQISLFDKQSNRALALSIQSKLYGLGLRYEIGTDIHYYEEMMQDKGILETLAQSEHLRWNAYHYSNGWRTMKDFAHQQRNKNAMNKTHSCLVDWEELDAVSEVFKHEYREMDRHLIKNIGNVLKKAGFGVVKIK